MASSTTPEPMSKMRAAQMKAKRSFNRLSAFFRAVNCHAAYRQSEFDFAQAPRPHHDSMPPVSPASPPLNHKTPLDNLHSAYVSQNLVFERSVETFLKSESAEMVDTKLAGGKVAKVPAYEGDVIPYGGVVMERQDRRVGCAY